MYQLRSCRTIIFRQIDLNHETEVIRAMLRQMPILTKIICNGLAGYSAAGIDSVDVLLSAPSLEELILRNVGLRSYRVSSLAHLRAFKMTFRHRLERAAFEMLGLQLLSEFTSVSKLLDPLRLQLETLHIPGESMCLSFLASAPWPQLRDFAISGACPDLDTSLCHLLNMMPRLESFTFAVAPYVNAPSFILWPADAPYEPCIERLDRLVISFPDPDDLIFSHLPSSMRELALRDTPRYFTRRKLGAGYIDHPTITRCKAPLLTCTAALRIFSTCSAEHIESLEIVVEADSRELDMLALITKRFPRLAFLEYHRYCVRHVPSEGDLSTVPIVSSELCERVADLPYQDLLLPALAGFFSLRHLRLNLDFPITYGVPFLDTTGESYEHEGSFQFVAQQANAVAAHMPWLTTISFFIPVTSRWRLFDIDLKDGHSPKAIERLGLVRYRSACNISFVRSIDGYYSDETAWL